MSNGDAAKENISQYWKDFFTKRADLLTIRSNDEAVKQWQDDHGGKAIPKSAMNGLTNVKSMMRSESGVKIKKKRGRPRKNPLPTPVAAAPAAARMTKPPVKLLESLEDHIDKCLGLINNQDGLEKIVQVLKQGPRLTIFQIGV